MTPIEDKTNGINDGPTMNELLFAHIDRERQQDDGVNYQQTPEPSPDMCHIMVDIETLSLQPNAVILSIAAVPFSLNNYCTHHTFFYQEVSTRSQPSRHIDVETLQFHLELMQHNGVTNLLDPPDGSSLHAALISLGGFLKRFDHVTLWSRGNFDFTILEHAFKSLLIPLPWKHWQLSDQRTVTKFAAVKKHNKTTHNAYNDCVDQIEDLMHAYFSCQIGFNTPFQTVTPIGFPRETKGAFSKYDGRPLAISDGKGALVTTYDQTRSPNQFYFAIKG